MIEGLYHLKWLILVHSVVYFNKNVTLFTARTTKLLYIAGGWRGPLTADSPRNRSESLNGWSEALTLTVGLGV